MAKINAASILDLIVKELAEIFHIHFAFVYVNYDNCAINHCIVNICRHYRRYDLTKFTNSRRFDKNSIGMIL